MVNSKKIENVLKLSAKERYSYFVRKVTDFEVLWGLYDNGWATLKSQEKTGMPFWSEVDFAKLCAIDNWANYVPREIPLNEFLSNWLPGMQSDGLFAAVFPTPSDKALVVLVEQLSSDLKEELQQYE